MTEAEIAAGDSADEWFAEHLAEIADGASPGKASGTTKRSSDVGDSVPDSVVIDNDDCYGAESHVLDRDELEVWNLKLYSHKFSRHSIQRTHDRCSGWCACDVRLNDNDALTI